ncbi:MAG: homoserine kinase [Candidatus Marsarchaeota archaeon]
MSLHRVMAFAPSSSANLGPGFDVLSVAHDAYEDSVEAELMDGDELRVEVNGEGVPLDYRNNSAAWAVYNMCRQEGLRVGVRLNIRKGVPIGLGLGSSGASAAAAVAAVAELLELRVSSDKLVEYAMKGEEAAAGEAHPDNVAASLLGGFTITASLSPLRVRRLKTNLEVNLMLFIPQGYRIEGKTRLARSMLPSHVPLSSVVRNESRLSALLAGLIEGDRELFSAGLGDDIVETARLPLFPYFPEVKEKAVELGALGACVSGAGPSVLVFTDGRSDEAAIATSGLNVCGKYGYKCFVKRARVTGGVRVEVE